MATPKKTTKGEARREPGSPTAAVAYVRVSSDEQAEKYGPDVQRRDIADFARRQGLELVAEYADLGVSGTTPLEQRPGLTAAFEAIAAGKAQALVCQTFSRLARETLQALLIQKAFRELGAEILYAEGVNGDDFWNEIRYAMASDERRKLVKRLADARKIKAEQGGFAQGRVPYGYRSVRGELEPDAETAETVRRIFADVARGTTPGKVARALDAAGIAPPKHGKRWTPQTVRVIVANDVYTARGGKAAHEPIVTVRQFRAAQRAIAARARSTPG